MKMKYLFSTVAAVTLVGCLVVSAQAATIFQADFEMTGGDATGQETQVGWTSVLVEQGGNGTNTVAVTDVGGSGVDLTLVANGSGGIFNARGGTGQGRSVDITGTSVNEVIEDIISARNGDDTLTVTLDNLTVGVQYLLTGYHNGSGGNFGFVDNGSGGGITITPSISAGATLVSSDVGVGSNITTGNSPGSAGTLDPSSIGFTATNTTVSLLYSSDGTAGFSPLGVSGFELTAVPEPTSLVLFALAGFGCVLGRRRN